MTDSQFIDPILPKIVYQPTKVICPKHGTHPHMFSSNIPGHEGHWCMLCALDGQLAESSTTTSLPRSFVLQPVTNLSPAAQAVRRDFAQIMRELHQRCRVSISATDALPITLETNDSSLQAGIDSLIVAALRAAADQLPRSAMYPSRDWGSGWRNGISDAEKKLLAIATELETQ